MADVYSPDHLKNKILNGRTRCPRRLHGHRIVVNDFFSVIKKIGRNVREILIISTLCYDLRYRLPSRNCRRWNTDSLTLVSANISRRIYVGQIRIEAVAKSDNAASLIQTKDYLGVESYSLGKITLNFGVAFGIILG